MKLQTTIKLSKLKTYINTRVKKRHLASFLGVKHKRRGVDHSPQLVPRLSMVELLTPSVLAVVCYGVTFY